MLNRMEGQLEFMFKCHSAAGNFTVHDLRIMLGKYLCKAMFLGAILPLWDIPRATGENCLYVVVG